MRFSALLLLSLGGWPSPEASGLPDPVCAASAAWSPGANASKDASDAWVELVGGAHTNRAAIGARVSVTANGLTQTHEVGGGHGHYGIQHDLVQTFGLGSACEAKVTVRWPDADRTTETVTLPAGHRFRLVQGEAPVVIEGAP